MKLRTFATDPEPVFISFHSFGNHLLNGETAMRALFQAHVHIKGAG
jgi:hypothetical protein